MPRHCIDGGIRKGLRPLNLCVLMTAACVLMTQALAQNSYSAGPGAPAPGPGCSCGAHPPGPPRDRTVAPYARTPEDLEPYRKFTIPYYENYTTPNIYTGAARDIADFKNVKEVRIGFLGPIAKQADQMYGIRMLDGAQMAIDDANARGGYGGTPFRLMPHDDYSNWQFGAESGEERPTDAAIWGAPLDAFVKMIYDEEDVAVFGSISSESTHMVLRLALKAEIPIVNSASTDPTVPETYIPWYFTDIQDDRVQSYTLARRIFTDLGLKRAALLRVNNRYGRMGVEKFRAASVRLGHPLVIEQKYLPGTTDFSRQLQIIRESHVDAIVLWGDEVEAAGILKQMRTLGMNQRVFGSYRTLGDDLLKDAGSAAEGFEAVFPYDASSKNPRWLDFNRRYEARFHEKPGQFASLAYDAMNALLESICKAGLNRARIHDALANIEEYDGVTGHMIFDPNQKNVAPMYLGTVHNGTISYSLQTMEKEQASQQKPYASIDEDTVSFAGPRAVAPQTDSVRVIVFGPHAKEIARSNEFASELHTQASTGKRWIALPVESEQNWGAASTQLVHALMDEHAVAVLALDRNAAHLSEQLALKTFVPVVAVSDDKTLTSANVPWIFRLPQSTTPVTALHILKEAVAKAGADPEKVRDVLASGIDFSGLAFLPSGELVQRQ